MHLYDKRSGPSFDPFWSIPDMPSAEAWTDSLFACGRADDTAGWVAAARALLLRLPPTPSRYRRDVTWSVSDSLTNLPLTGPFSLETRLGLVNIAQYLPTWQILREMPQDGEGFDPFLAILGSIPEAHRLLERIIEKGGWLAESPQRWREVCAAAEQRDDFSRTDRLMVRLFRLSGSTVARELPASAARPDVPRYFDSGTDPAAMASGLRKKMRGSSNFLLIFELLRQAETLEGRDRERARLEIGQAFAECDFDRAFADQEREPIIAVAKDLRPWFLPKAFGLCGRDPTPFYHCLLGDPLAHGVLRAMLKKQPVDRRPLRSWIEDIVDRNQACSPPQLSLGLAHFIGHRDGRLTALYDALEQRNIADGEAAAPVFADDRKVVGSWLKQGTDEARNERNGEAAAAFVENGNVWRAIFALSQNTPHGSPDFADGLAALSPYLANGAYRLALCSVVLARSFDTGAILDLAGHLRELGFDVLAANLLATRTGSSKTAARLFGRIMDKLASPRDRVALWEELGAIHSGPVFRSHLATAQNDALLYREAEQTMQKLRTASGERPGLVRARLQLFGKRGDLTRAIRSADEYLAQFPESRPLESDTWRYRFEAGEWHFDESEEERLEDRTQLAYFRLRADHFVTRGESAKAEAIHTDIARLTGQAPDYHRLLNAKFGAGKFAEAAAFCGQLKMRFPGDRSFWKKSAQVAERLRNYDAMLDNCVELLALKPDDQNARSALARALVYLDRDREALDWLDDCQGETDDTVWVDAMRAFAHARHGRGGEASAALGEVYRRCRAITDEYRAGQARDPADTLLLDGRHVAHQNPEAAPIYANFNRCLERLTQGPVALIGNAPSILGSGLGKEIDSFETVVRLNDFVIEGYEADLGERVDFWYSSANRQASPHRPSVAKATVIMKQNFAQHFPEVRKFSQGRLGFEVDPATSTYLPPCFAMMSEGLTYPFPSTGFRMIQILEFLVQTEYTTFGFDFFKSDEMHYFDKGETHLQIGEVHAIDFERDFVATVLEPYGRYGSFRRT